MDDLDKVKAPSFAEKYSKGKKTAKTWVSNSMYWLEAVALFAIAILFSFAEFVITGGGSTPSETIKGISVRVVIIFICSYFMFIVMSEKGEKTGKSTLEYLKAFKLYTDLKTALTAKEYNMSEFCKWYVAEELKATRENLLTYVNVPYEVWEEKYKGLDKKGLKQATMTYKEGEDIKERPLSKREIKTFYLCNRTKQIRLSQEMLISKQKTRRTTHAFGATGKQAMAFVRIRKFITSFIMSTCLGIIAIDFMLNISWKSFVIMLVRLIPMIINIFTGYISGFKAYAEYETNYLNDKADILTSAVNYFDIPIDKSCERGV